MKKLSFCILSVALVAGCTKAPGPIISIEKARLMEVKKLAVAPIVNATPSEEITPTVEKALEYELSKLRRYKMVGKEESDAIIECTITQYVPFESQIVEKEREHDIYEFEETKKKAKEKAGCGCIGGGIVDAIIPAYKVKTKKEYGIVTRAPVIGMELTLRSKDGYVIYKGSKLMSEKSRIPDCYFATYEEVLIHEQLNSMHFITSLGLKELLEPLR